MHCNWKIKHLDIKILDINNLKVQPILVNDVAIPAPDIDEL
ncbi:MAG: hypothetical protein ACJAS9_001220 [Polaribacter sp.]|jgi:hypothetical protein